MLHHAEMMPQFARAADLPLRRGELSRVGLGDLRRSACSRRSCSPTASPQFVDAGVRACRRRRQRSSVLDAWAATLAYTFQIYFDFSGYSDMAIGLARMFGIRLPLNFNSPYKARSIIDFWRRWHMTLSRFLRDYLYIPLGGNRRGTAAALRQPDGDDAARRALARRGWTFVVWGGLHGIYLVHQSSLAGLARRQQLRLGRVIRCERAGCERIVLGHHLLRGRGRLGVLSRQNG